MKGELDAVDNVMKNPQRPFTAIMGGSKVSSKNRYYYEPDG